MYTCDQCADLLLDSLYGLLEAEEAQQLREHVSGCAACQAARAQAEAQQRLLARAAHVAREVPAFTAPVETAIKDSVAAPPVEQPPATVLALPTTLPVRSRYRLWPWLATAAALLIAAGALSWSYESSLQKRVAVLDYARADLRAIDARLVSATREYEKEDRQLPAQIQARQVRMQISGSAVYQVDAPAQVRVSTQDLASAPAAARLDVTVLDAAGKEVAPPQHLESTGEKAVVLPAGLGLKPGTEARLVVKATSRQGGTAELREPLTSAGPTYETQIVLNKPAFRAGEVVLFRTLSLTRFLLKPPGKEIPFTATVRDEQQVIRKRFEGKTRPDGIGGGEFSLAGLPAGTGYRLEVALGEAASGQVRSSPFVILRAEPADLVASYAAPNSAGKQFNFERPVYAPGDQVRGEFRQLPRSGAVGNQAVQINVRQANGQAIPVQGAPPGKPLQTTTDNQGRAPFELQMPRDIGPGAPIVEVEVPTNKGNTLYKQAIPVAPPQPGVEFFAEGGDLVAGVSNRVYFRSQTPQGTPADLDGKVVDRLGNEAVRVQSRSGSKTDGTRGLGSFTLTPKVGESYSLQVPVTKQTQKVIPLPPVHAAGVTLSVPEAVSAEGTPINAVVQSAPAERRLLLVASCRGQIVDQRFLQADPAGTKVELTPVPGTRGVIRLTAYEILEEQLLPRAERLVYQVPSQRLVLSWADAAQAERRSYRPGEHVQLRIKSLNEKNEPESALILAAAVDERALPRGSDSEEGPPAFFYLTSEVPSGADLENADFLVSDTPQARAALGLFLATEGWRRFRDPEAAVAVTERPAVFSRDNFEETAGRVNQQVALARDELRRQALRERTALQEERTQKAAASTAAAAALADFRELPPRAARLGVAVLVLVLLAAGGILLLTGLIRAVRGKQATFALGGAFAALLLCLVIYGVSGDMRVQDRGASPSDLRAELPARPLPAFPDRVSAPQRDLRSEQRSAPVGRFAEAPQGRRGPAKDTPQQPLALSRAREILRQEQILRRADDAKVRENSPAPEAQRKAQALGGSGPTTRAMEKTSPAAPGAAPTPLSPPPPAPGFKPPASPAPKTAAASTNEPEVAKKPRSDSGAAAKGALQPDAPHQLSLREYTSRGANRPGTPSPDTLLWYPALIAENGTAPIALDLPGQPTTYRLLLYAHSPSGRLGVYRGKLATEAK
jgi:hypothetical protein